MAFRTFVLYSPLRPAEALKKLSVALQYAETPRDLVADVTRLFKGTVSDHSFAVEQVSPNPRLQLSMPVAQGSIENEGAGCVIRVFVHMKLITYFWLTVFALYAVSAEYTHYSLFFTCSPLTYKCAGKAIFPMVLGGFLVFFSTLGFFLHAKKLECFLAQTLDTK